MNASIFKWIASCAVLFATLGTNQLASATVFTFDSDNFGTDPKFSSVTTFEFRIDFDAEIVAGEVYSNPLLNMVEYRVFGSLESGTPSGFPAFNLERTIVGSDFYDQGSSLNFAVSAAADLSDGLQMSELVGDEPVFVFNGREVGTGRYHPSLFELNSDGTGMLRNSNNFGGINPASEQFVDVEIGEEYITELTFSPSLTITATSVPEPSATVLLGAALIGLASRRRRMAA